MRSTILQITGEQIRAARALARIEQTELAGRSGLSLETIKRLERTRGAVQAHVRTLGAVHDAFSDLGVSFQNGEGSAGVRRTFGVLAVGQAGQPAGTPPPLSTTELQRLIYVSLATTTAPRQAAQNLPDIMATAVRRNASLQITGALLVCGRSYLQVLEGDDAAVQSLFGGIGRDGRHTDIRVLQNEPVESRHFSDWSMCAGRLSPTDPIVLDYPEMSHGFEPQALRVSSAKVLLSLVQCAHPRVRS
jgi:transcriptional regulator with XRE-family HTH domain